MTLPVTEIVFSPRRILSRENFMASTGRMMRMSRPPVSWSGRYFFTFLMISASWALRSSSQKMAGDPVARALATARPTQFWIGASFAWHILKMVVLVPHLAAVADDVGHRGVDDDVARHVQVRDALARVDHGQGGPVLVK